MKLNPHVMVIGSVTLFTAIAIAILSRYQVQTQPKPVFVLPVTEVEVSKSPALKYAAEKYWERGGNYQWGTNDCSVFVSEYLMKRGVPIKSRLTTALLAKPDVAQHGLSRVSEPRPGDILNYRYRRPQDQTTKGHCGVVVQRGDELWVMHNNSVSGLVVETLDRFEATAKAFGVESSNYLVLRSKG
ncbi:MAG: NlpC/P60 family protein [Fimbriimonadaceae bacterium]|jgi:hypothetical protein|nr:NlpC/P60 family protein [Fimbriimonadaceae bacterium]